MKQTLFCKMKFREGSLYPATKEDQIKFDLYMKQFKDNSDFDLIVSLADEVKTYPQLQKIHVIIRDLSDYTGMSFNEMKSYIKFKAGLFNYENNKEGKPEPIAKSFRVCTKKELDTAINVAEEMAAQIDCVLSV